MQNHKKQDSISVDIINQVNEVKTLSEKPVGNASKDPFCVYDNRRHAVGSTIINRNGSKNICTEDGSWKITE